jgi:hypothetical protein
VNKKMKKITFAFIALISAASPAFAEPFRYETKCYLDLPNSVQQVDEKCVVIETRESGGSLKTRNIFSNAFGLTIKMRWNGQKYVTWDSYNKFEYSYPYKPNSNIQENGIVATYVLPGFSVMNISWD